MPKNKPLIVHIFFSGLGGHGSVAFSLIEADLSTEFKYVIIFYGIEPITQSYLSKCKNLGIEYHFIHKKRGLDLQAMINVYRELKRLNPHTILLHSTNLILCTWVYSWHKKVNCIAIEHKSNATKTFLERRWSSLCMLLANKIVVLTNSYLQELKKITGIFFRHTKISIIPNGIDTNLFEPKEKNTESVPIRLGMLARMASPKDQQTLLEAAKILKMNGKEIMVLLAGDGETMGRLEEWVKENQLNEYVRFLGQLTESESVTFLQSITFYVHSSLSETMSTSILQAMSCGLPVIASDIPGINNFIEQGKTGLLFRSQNPRDLSDKINYLLDNKNLAKALVQEGRKLVEENYSSLQMFNQYRKLILN